jgi:Ser/Thr protein kinase RdoA (MazF antagonist)
MALEPPPAPGDIPRTHRAAITELLARYGLQVTAPPSPVDHSLNNHNYRAVTSEGSYFVRVHRKSQVREAGEREQRILLWATEQGLPVVAALADPEGRTLHPISGMVLSLFPWATGRQIASADATPAIARAMGAMHGRLQVVLRDYPPLELPRPGPRPHWDTAAAIDDLSRVDDLIRYYPSPGEEQLRVQASLREQLTLLESSEPRPRSDFDSLPVQPVHGDYHLGNILFDADSDVSAVLDWEFATQMPAIHELLRGLSLSGLLDEPLMAAYLAGYVTTNELDREQCAPGVELAWQALLHNTWDYRQRFIDGNRRVDPFSQGTRIQSWSDPAFRARLTETLLAFAV